MLMAEGGFSRASLIACEHAPFPEGSAVGPAGAPPNIVVEAQGECGGGAVSVAESVLAPPGPIPNPVVTQGSAGEYCGGDPVGGEAAAGTALPVGA